MKLRILTAALAIAFAASCVPAKAQAPVADLSKTSCKEFLTSGKEGIMIVWAWLYGYYADNDADPIIDFGKMTTQGQALAEACKQKPDIDIISAAKPIYEMKK